MGKVLVDGGFVSKSTSGLEPEEGGGEREREREGGGGGAGIVVVCRAKLFYPALNVKAEQHSVCLSRPLLSARR